ncbi:MAG: hypothetical protein M3Y59_24460 [Myxococcota bacterium]|nr:hypothetical protein [Myxococcota bacterium]
MRSKQGWLALGLVLLGAAWPGPVLAQAVFIESRTEAQVYQVRSFRGLDNAHPVLLPRRRLVSSLALDGWELITGQDLSFQSDVRVFADFGVPPGEPSKVDGLKAVDAELLSGNLRYRVAGLDARLGRQVWWDALDAFALDGAHVRYLSPFHLGLELYGGLWVKGSSFAASSVYQPDGVRESDARRVALGDPDGRPLLDDLEPVVGGKLLLDGLGGVSAGLQYRRAWVAEQVTFERAGAELRFSTPRLPISIFAAADADLIKLALANLRAEARYDAGPFSASAQVARYSPILSTDSIWYWFSSGPRDEADLRVDLLPLPLARFHLRGTVTRFAPVLRLADPAFLSQVTSLTFGASGGGAVRWEDLSSALEVSWRNGREGRSFLVDLTGGWTPPGRAWSLQGRLALADLTDRVQPRLTGTYLGGQLWGSYALSEEARVSLVAEHNRSAGRPPDTKVFAAFSYQLALGRSFR